MKKMHRILLAAMLLTAAAASLPATGAERTMKVTDNYLWMPVSHKFDRARMTISIPGREDMPVNVRIPRDGVPEYYTFLYVEPVKGKKITITYPDDLKGMDLIKFAPDIPDADKIYHEPNRPQLHFTTRRRIPPRWSSPSTPSSTALPQRYLSTEASSPTRRSATAHAIPASCASAATASP